MDYSYKKNKRNKKIVKKIKKNKAKSKNNEIDEKCIDKSNCVHDILTHPLDEPVTDDPTEILGIADEMKSVKKYDGPIHIDNSSLKFLEDFEPNTEESMIVNLPCTEIEHVNEVGFESKDLGNTISSLIEMDSTEDNRHSELSELLDEMNFGETAKYNETNTVEIRNIEENICNTTLIAEDEIMISGKSCEIDNITEKENEIINVFIKQTVDEAVYSEEGFGIWGNGNIPKSVTIETESELENISGLVNENKMENMGKDQQVPKKEEINTEKSGLKKCLETEIKSVNSNTGLAEFHNCIRRYNPGISQAALDKLTIVEYDITGISPTEVHQFLVQNQKGYNKTNFGDRMFANKYLLPVNPERNESVLYACENTVLTGEKYGAPNKYFEKTGAIPKKVEKQHFASKIFKKSNSAINYNSNRNSSSMNAIPFDKNKNHNFNRFHNNQFFNNKITVKTGRTPQISDNPATSLDKKITNYTTAKKVSSIISTSKERELELDLEVLNNNLQTLCSSICVQNIPFIAYNFVIGGELYCIERKSNFSPVHTVNEKLENYFSKYGKIIWIYYLPKYNNLDINYAVITFESPSSVQKILNINKHPNHIIVRPIAHKYLINYNLKILDILSDECILHIFKYLSFDDHITLFYISKRFQKIFAIHYEHKKCINFNDMICNKGVRILQVLWGGLKLIGNNIEICNIKYSNYFDNNYDGFIRSIIRFFPNLKELNIEKKLNDNPLQFYISKIKFFNDFNKFKGLVKLSLINFGNGHTLTDEHIKLLSNFDLNIVNILEEFNLQENYEITGQYLQHFNKLKILILNKCYHITNYNLIDTLKSLKYLDKLDIRYCYDLNNGEFYEKFNNYCSNLKILMITIKLTQNFPMQLYDLEKLKKLREIYIDNGEKHNLIMNNEMLTQLIDFLQVMTSFEYIKIVHLDKRIKFKIRTILKIVDLLRRTKSVSKSTGRLSLKLGFILDDGYMLEKDSLYISLQNELIIEGNETIEYIWPGSK